MPTSRKRGGLSIFGWTLIAVIAATAIAVGVLVLVYVGEDPGREGPTVEAILEDQAQFVGLEVTLEGRVIETGDDVFALGEDHDERLLVVPEPGGTLPPVEEGEPVEAAGTIRRSAPAGVEARGELADELRDQPLLVADSVSTGGG